VGRVRCGWGVGVSGGGGEHIIIGTPNANLASVRPAHGELCVNSHRRAAPVALLAGLYMILPSPILYGVWHKKGGSVGGRVLRNGNGQWSCDSIAIG